MPAATSLIACALARWLGSLRWALLVTIVLTVALIFLNVWVTAHLMFISEYDLMVTALLLVFAGGIALIFGFFVFSAITDSIRELAQAAEQIAQGKLDTRLAVHGNDELAEFGDDLQLDGAELARSRRAEAASSTSSAAT